MRISSKLEMLVSVIKYRPGIFYFTVCFLIEFIYDLSYPYDSLLFAICMIFVLNYVNFSVILNDK